jgi:hypothetical protein
LPVAEQKQFVHDGILPPSPESQCAEPKQAINGS